MVFKTPLIKAKLIQRYKRFLADVQLSSGDTITIHTANTGSMMGCSDPGSIVWISDSNNLKRKCRYSWELTQTFNNKLIGINTHLANVLVKEAISNGVIKELQGYDKICFEVPYGNENSRIDILLENVNSEKKCYIEVKNVTAVVDDIAIFPDAVSKRGTKHLRELVGVASKNDRAVLCFCVQREDATSVRPADEIDPVYGKTLRYAMNNGVEVIAYRAVVTPKKIELQKKLTIVT